VSRTRGDIASRLAEVAGWGSATRDDGGVASTVARTRAVDRVHSLGEAGFFDELFYFVRELGVMPLLEALEPDDNRRLSHPFLVSVLVTLMRCICGVESQLATQDLLLSDEALMALVGFNATQVKEGASMIYRQREQSTIPPTDGSSPTAPRAMELVSVRAIDCHGGIHAGQALPGTSILRTFGLDSSTSPSCFAGTASPPRSKTRWSF
jgi:hypothetical protein